MPEVIKNHVTRQKEREFMENSLFQNCPVMRYEPEVMLDVYKTVISETDAIYCSGPLTSGRRAIDWYKRHPTFPREVDALPFELRREFTESVVNENAKQLRHFVSEIRKTTHRVVIDPSAIQESNWSQGQWLEFWCEVIAKFVQTVVLVPDWQYSKGACVECLFALQLERQVRLHDHSVIEYHRASECIQSAGVELEANGFGSGHFERISQLVEQYLHGGKMPQP
jgi:hypothetical protein